MNGSSLSFTESEVATYYQTHAPRLKQTPAREWRGNCPIHQGRDLNFAVNPATGFYYCFSQCGSGGSIYDLDQALYGGTFPEVRDRVFSTIGRPVERLTKQQKRDLALKRRRDEQAKILAGYWHRGSLLTIEQQLEEDKRWLFQSEGKTQETLGRAVGLNTQREKRLRTMSPSELLRVFRQQYAADPIMASHLIRLGKDELDDIRSLAVSFVRMLEIQAMRERKPKQ